MVLWYAVWLGAVALTFRYLWWLKSILEWKYWFLAMPFFEAECCILAFFITGYSLRLVTLLSKWMKEKKEIKGVSAGNTEFPRILIMIPVCGEPIEEVKKTVVSMLKIDYPQDRMHVAITDDRGDPLLPELAAEYGIAYITHPHHDESKAGNLNRALAQLRKSFCPDWVLVVDTGDIVDPEIMKSVKPRMGEDKLGFIQVERHFSFTGVPLVADFHYFYEVIQPRRDEVGSAFACGSGAFWNVRAIDELGGFSSWNLVEDLTTSYLLQLRGWHGRYISGKAFHWSEYVPDLPRMIKQRWQWAIDTYRLFFWKNPFAQKSLSWMLRWDYGEMGLVYLLSFPILMIRMMPFALIWMPTFLFNGHSGALTYWQYFLPVICARMACEWIQFRRSKVPFVNWKRQQSLYEGLMPVFCVAALQTLVMGPNRKPTYHITGKGVRQGFFWHLIKFQLAWFFGGVGTVWYGYLASTDVTPILLTSTVWLIYSLWLLIPFITAAAATSFWMFRLIWRCVVIGAFISVLMVLLVELYASPVYSAVEHLIMHYIG